MIFREGGGNFFRTRLKEEENYMYRNKIVLGK